MLERNDSFASRSSVLMIDEYHPINTARPFTMITVPSNSIGHLDLQVNAQLSEGALFKCPSSTREF